MVCITALYTFGACQKEDKLDKDNLQCPVVAKDGPNNDIVGKWKLVKVQPAFSNPRTEDYSCGNVEYEFQEGGILIVTGSAENIRGYDDGQYSFEFKDIKLHEGIKEKYTVKIDDMSIACGIQDNKMVLNDSFLDGDILYFVRIE